MDDSFRTFLQSSSGVTKHHSNNLVTENKIVINADPRVKVLQEKVSYFCKKYGEIGADALDDFFKESVQKFSGFKNIKSKSSFETVVETKIPTNTFDRANAILAGEEKPHPGGGSNKSSDGDDIMKRAMAIMG